MSHNPFAQLQRLLQDKNASTSSVSAKGSSPSSSSTSRPSTAEPSVASKNSASGNSPASEKNSVKTAAKPYGTRNITKTAHSAQKHSSAKAPLHDEESALFLRTVSNLPAPSSSQEQAEDTAFKQAMQAAGILPTESSTGKKRSKKRLKKGLPPTGPATQAPIEPAPDPSRTTNPTTPPATAAVASPSSSAHRHGVHPSSIRSDNGTTTQTIPAKNAALSQQSDTAPQTMKHLPSKTRTEEQDTADDFDSQEAALFAKAMNDVAPVSKRGREVHAPAETKIPQHPSGKTPAQIMQEIIDGRIEFAIQHTGEYMEGFVQGVSPEVLDKLRLGQLSPESHVDLHGLNALQAYTELVRFIRNAYQRNMRTVTVITGRGINSPDGIAVIRNLIQEWLTHDPFKRVVLAFCSAQPRDGGAGALYVLLRKYKKSMGKIQWELPYSGPDATL